MSSAGEPELLEVGRVSKAHGIVGELRIVPHWDGSDALSHAEQIWLTLNGQRVSYELENDQRGKSSAVNLQAA